MPDISKELNDIMNARYGEDVRQSIYDAIDKINDNIEEDGLRYMGILSTMFETWPAQLTSVKTTGYYLSGNRLANSDNWSDLPPDCPNELFTLLVFSNKDSYPFYIMKPISSKYVAFKYDTNDWSVLDTSDIETLNLLSLQFKGVLRNLYEDRPLSLSQILNTGYYVSGIKASNISDLPDDFPNDTFIFIVLSNNNSLITQLALARESGYICWRYKTSASEAFGNWAHQKNYFEYRGVLSNLISEYPSEIGSIVKSGYYVSGNRRANSDNWSDLPPDCPNELFALLVFNDSSDGGSVPFYIFKPINSDYIAFRYSTNDWSVLKAYSLDSDIPQRKWVAFGDSITMGWASTGSDSAAQNPAGSYIDIANSYYFHNNLLNLGEGSQGFTTNGNDGRSAIQEMQNAEFSDADLVTMCYGINDYHNGGLLGNENSAAGDGTISGNCRQCIEYILQEASNAAFVVILPINACRVATTEDTKYSINYAYKGRTLKEISDIIAYWCDYYNVPYIDWTNRCAAINIKNIKNILLDDIHPNAYGYDQLARVLINELPYR